MKQLCAPTFKKPTTKTSDLHERSKIKISMLFVKLNKHKVLMTNVTLESDTERLNRDVKTEGNAKYFE
jgi:hypothetical protein